MTTQLRRVFRGDVRWLAAIGAVGLAALWLPHAMAQEFGDQQGDFGIYGWQQNQIGPPADYLTGQLSQGTYADTSQDQGFGDEQGDFGIYGRHSEFSQWSSALLARYRAMAVQPASQAAQVPQPAGTYRSFSQIPGSQIPGSQIPGSQIPGSQIPGSPSRQPQPGNCNPTPASR